MLGQGFKKLVPAWLSAALAILDRCKEAQDGESETLGRDEGATEDGQPAAPMWQEVYFTLTSAEKLFQKLPELVLSAQFQVGESSQPSWSLVNGCVLGFTSCYILVFFCSRIS